MRIDEIGAPLLSPEVCSRLVFTSLPTCLELKCRNMAAPSTDVQIVPAKKPTGKLSAPYFNNPLQPYDFVALWSGII